MFHVVNTYVSALVPGFPLLISLTGYIRISETRDTESPVEDDNGNIHRRCLLDGQTKRVFSGPRGDWRDETDKQRNSRCLLEAREQGVSTNSELSVSRAQNAHECV